MRLLLLALLALFARAQIGCIGPCPDPLADPACLCACRNQTMACVVDGAFADVRSFSHVRAGACQGLTLNGALAPDGAGAPQLAALGGALDAQARASLGWPANATLRSVSTATLIHATGAEGACPVDLGGFAAAAAAAIRDQPTPTACAGPASQTYGLQGCAIVGPGRYAVEDGRWCVPTLRRRSSSKGHNHGWVAGVVVGALVVLVLTGATMQAVASKERGGEPPTIQMASAAFQPPHNQVPLEW